MRVVHLAAGKQFGGVERLLTTLGRHSDRIDTCFALCFGGRTAEQLREAGAQVEVLGGARVSRPWTISALRWRLMELLEERRAEVVVTHGCWPHAMGGKVVRKCGLPLVFWAHEVMAGEHWLERWAGKIRPDRAIVGSEAVRVGVKRVFGEIETALLRCPVEYAGLAGGQGGRVRGVNAPVVIAMAARMDAIKGQGVLLEALARVKGRWECWIIGGAQTARQEAYLKGLKDKAEALGLSERVKFLGQREDVGRLLEDADIYCQPNTGPEAFGISFIEAMDAGLAVVSSGIGGACEIVDESCGILTRAGDAADVAGALERLIGDEGLRTRMGQAGRKRARELCEPRERMRELQTILEACRHDSAFATT